MAKRILANPEKYEQAEWCGTACCIAGHACQIDNAEESAHEGPVRLRAKDLLDLSREQFDALCLRAVYWPEPFATKFAWATSKEDRAQIAHDRIMHMVNTGE